MYLGSEVMVWLSILAYGGANLYGLPLVRGFHLFTAIFKRTVLRSFESDLFILSSNQSSEVALLEPQTWRIF
jgi:hypothetical protein